MSDSIERVGVIGAGQMGSGIAEVSARAGADVMVYEPTEALTTAGHNRITKSLERGVSAGKVTERERDAALAKLKFTTSLADLSDRQLVIEAVVEDEAVKAKIFAELDELITDPDAVLASNTSSIPIMKIAAATKNPSRVLGLHFFNPVPVLPLVELVSTLVTSDGAAATGRGASRAARWASRWCAAATRSGFVVNALLVPYLLSAIRMVGGGRRHGRRRRQGSRCRSLAPDGPAAVVRSHRARHDETHRGLDVRRVQGPELRSAAAVAADGRGRSTRQEVRPRLLRVLIRVVLWTHDNPERPASSSGIELRGTLGSLSLNASSTRSYCAITHLASGRSTMECGKVCIHGAVHSAGRAAADGSSTMAGNAPSGGNAHLTAVATLPRAGAYDRVLCRLTVPAARMPQFR